MFLIALGIKMGATFLSLVVIDHQLPDEAQ